ncbi:NADP-dependent oxidoreductase [Herbiconiux solani]|uniref:NADP-dependent oxidoreductase n=1 Tax=Herbiconiux solani TaxID=661329 RepID=UPI000826B72C|nr:NADP-dependent oxidoreductase [Herbiconiux solani]
MAETMRAIIQDELGGPEVLHEASIEIPTPGIGQVLVRVRAAGVNPADFMNRQTGVFSGTPPFTLGWDLAGVVAAVGPGITLFEPGDDVFGLLPFPRGAGAYAEYVVAPPRALIRKPDALSFTQAASLPLAGLTAWQMLVETAHISDGSTVLITGATGGVGHLAVQIAKALGAHVTAVVSAQNAELARTLGADAIIDYTSTDFSRQVRGLDVVFDVIGGDYPLRALDVLRPGGMLISTLPQSLGPSRAAAAERGLRVAGVFVESDRLGLMQITELVVSGTLTPLIAATFPLERADQAHSFKGQGKVVLEVP